MFWKKIILNAFKNVVDLIDVDKALQKENSQVIFVVDSEIPTELHKIPYLFLCHCPFE